MSKITKQDTNGVKPLLGIGELGYDNYPAGGDAGRMYVGTGTENIPLAKKTEVTAVDTKADTHIGRVDNPHSVTKAQVGLANVDNTADSNKSVLSATKLATARTISLTGDVSGNTSFDGSGNVSMTTVVADDSHNHIISNVDGLQDALDSKTPLNGTGASGTWGINVNGNASTATKLATARTIALSGDVTGSVSFNGSANVSITTTVADDSHNHIISNVDGLQAALDSKANQANIYTKEEVLGAVGNIMSPLLDLPLKNSLTMKAGVGSTTFTRASTATYIDRYGVLQYADVDEPRFEKDGLLIEGSSTNLGTYSQTFTNSSYIVANSGTFEQGKIHIDKSNDAVKFVTSTTLESQQFNKANVSLPINSTITDSVIVEKDGSYDYFVMASGNFSSWETRGNVIFNLADGTIYRETTDAGTGTISGAITDLGNGRYRCELRGQVRNAELLNSHLYMSVREIPTTSVFTGDGTSGVILHYTQSEALPFATSYIPTTDSAVTRSADKCMVVGDYNVPYRDLTLDVVFKTAPFRYKNRMRAITLISSNGDDKLTCGFDDVNSAVYVDDDSMATIYHPANAEDKHRLTVSFDTGIVRLYYNGVLVSTIDKGLTDTYDKGSYISIGGADYDDYVSNINDCIESVKIYDKILTPTEVALLG